MPRYTTTTRHPAGVVDATHDQPLDRNQGLWLENRIGGAASGSEPGARARKVGRGAVTRPRGLCRGRAPVATPGRAPRKGPCGISASPAWHCARGSPAQDRSGPRAEPASHGSPLYLSAAPGGYARAKPGSSRRPPAVGPDDSFRGGGSPPLLPARSLPLVVSRPGPRGLGPSTSPRISGPHISGLRISLLGAIPAPAAGPASHDPPRRAGARGPARPPGRQAFFVTVEAARPRCPPCVNGACVPCGTMHLRGAESKLM
jgi:hypothetical protein